MKKLSVSHDTSAFEVPATLNEEGKLTAHCAQQALAKMNTHGFVILTNLLSEEEANDGLELIRQTIADPERTRCTFASETDNRYVRRDFCSLPSTPTVTGYAATICQRLEGVLSEFCGRSHPLLEITTLTSHYGSSHQYVHRDPSGVIGIFAAVEDVSPEQGGTVFVPGTHQYGGAESRHGGRAYELMELFRTRCNFHIFWHNFRKLWGMRKDEESPLAPGEFLDRVFSKKWDAHQPNFVRFMLGKNALFSLHNLGPRTLWKLYRNREVLKTLFTLVQTAPRKGSVMLYRSDLLHAGPDNRSPDPRRLLSINISRDMIEPSNWFAGYSPHPTLSADPITFGDLLDFPAPAPTAKAKTLHQDLSKLVD